MRPPTAALALSALLVLSGCLGVFQSAPSDPGAEAVVDDAVAVSDHVDTFRFETRLRAETIGSGDGRARRASATGVVDRTDERLRLRTTVEETNRTVYVIGNTTYTQCAEPWSGWGKDVQEELDDDWAGQDPLGGQLALLAESPVTWAGNESVGGVSAHVIEARPSGRTLRQFGDNPRALIDLSGPRIENATLTAWIAADSSRLLRTELTLTVAGEEGEARGEVTTTFTGYGDAVSIALPESAQDDPYELGCPQS